MDSVSKNALLSPLLSALRELHPGGRTADGCAPADAATRAAAGAASRAVPVHRTTQVTPVTQVTQV